MTFFVRAPLINANEETMTLVEWFKAEGEQINKGEILCLLETAKSTYELQAEERGYLRRFVENGAELTVGQVIAALAAEKDEMVSLPQDAVPSDVEEQTESGWTKKALILARKFGYDPERIEKELGKKGKITEADILKFREELLAPAPLSLPNAAPIQRILILGGGNIATLILDILSRVPGQEAIGILDDNPHLQGKKVLHTPVLGGLKDVHHLWEEGVFDAITLAIGVLPLRADLFDELTAKGIDFCNVIDPTALVLTNARMGKGNMVMSFCRIGPESVIGNNNFLSAYVNIEHHNILGDHCTFGPSVYMSGGVRIGSRVRFGSGVFVEPRLQIGDDVTIASGVALTTNVPPGAVVKSRANFSIT